MQSGILTDTFSLERVEAMAADDWRRRNPEFQEQRLGRNLALRDALRPIAARHGVSIAAVAVAWTLSWPGVSGAIVGARSPSQVDGWLAAGNLTLEKEDLSEIADAVKWTQAGGGARKAMDFLRAPPTRRGMILSSSANETPLILAPLARPVPHPGRGRGARGTRLPIPAGTRAVSRER